MSIRSSARGRRARSSKVRIPCPTSAASPRVLISSGVARRCAPAVMPLFLVSGGSSSLVESLRDGVSLEDLRALNSARSRRRLGHRHAQLRNARGCRGSRPAGWRACSAGAARWRCSSPMCPGDDPDVIGSGLLGRDAGAADRDRAHVVADIGGAVRAAWPRRRRRTASSSSARAALRWRGRGRRRRVRRGSARHRWPTAWCGAANPR